MSAADGFKTVWTLIRSDSGVLSGLVQIIASLTSLLITTLTSKGSPFTPPK
jgi:hypothetical protein